MSAGSWKHEVKSVAERWPREFRARFHNGVWELLGGSDEVRREFEQIAQRIHRELNFPDGDSDAVTALLYRLKENRHHVRLNEKRKKGRGGHSGLESKATIAPLRSAVIQYVIHGPDRQVRSKTVAASGAARQNRVFGERKSIVEALQQLGQPVKDWPSFAREFQSEMGRHGLYRFKMSPARFQPPFYDRLNESKQDWIAAADRKWQEHREAFLSGLEFWAQKGVDEEIPKAKRIRGAGPGGGNRRRGPNTARDMRYRWAAQYLMRVPLKEIAAQSGAAVTTVGRVARGILAGADWLKPRRARRGPK